MALQRIILALMIASQQPMIQLIIDMSEKYKQLSNVKSCLHNNYATVTYVASHSGSFCCVALLQLYCYLQLLVIMVMQSCALHTECMASCLVGQSTKSIFHPLNIMVYYTACAIQLCIRICIFQFYDVSDRVAMVTFCIAILADYNQLLRY